MCPTTRVCIHTASPPRFPSKRLIPFINLASKSIKREIPCAGFLHADHPLSPSPGRARYIWLGSNGSSSLLPKKGKSNTNGTRDSTVYRMTRICKQAQLREEREREGDRQTNRQTEREEPHGRTAKKITNRASERNEPAPLASLICSEERGTHRLSTNSLQQMSICSRLVKSCFFCHAPRISMSTTTFCQNGGHGAIVCRLL